MYPVANVVYCGQSVANAGQQLQSAAGLINFKLAHYYFVEIYCFVM